MVKIKSFSVDEGDTFYIKHSSDNFTIIDCNLKDEVKEQIVKEIYTESRGKNIIRFISTHPDEDHILGIGYLFDNVNIPNFYCVENNVNKDDPSDSFKDYCNLRDDKQKAFYISKDCSRKWMNLDGEDENGKYIGSSGIHILWPDLNHYKFKEALKAANNDGTKVNNISPIIKYSLKNGVTILWFGDVEFDFMESICKDVKLPEADIIFAPHHGRISGSIPSIWLEQINPSVIIIGEAASKNLNYYPGYNVITQNSAKDITLICENNFVNFYSSSDSYEKRDFLQDNKLDNCADGYYIGTLKVKGVSK